MKYKNLFCSALALLCIQLTACTKEIPPGDYDTSEIGKIKKVVPGVIISRRPVNIHNKANENAVTPPAPTAESDYNSNRTRGVEYVIKLNTGSIISVLQAEDLNLKTKEHILVIYGDNTRVMPDDGGDTN